MHHDDDDDEEEKEEERRYIYSKAQLLDTLKRNDGKNGKNVFAFARKRNTTNIHTELQKDAPPLTKKNILPRTLVF